MDRTATRSSEIPGTIAHLIEHGLGQMADWESTWRDYPVDASWDLDPAAMTAAIEALTERLTDNYPFFHPDYAAQMLMPPHPVAAAAYAIAQRINPNAHASDGGPATTKLEIEVVDALKAMFGYDPSTSLGHLTSSGTIANLEALWVSRELHPDKAIAYSNLAHYTHSRMCQLLRVEGIGDRHRCARPHRSGRARTAARNRPHRYRGRDGRLDRYRLGRPDRRDRAPGGALWSAGACRRRLRRLFRLARGRRRARSCRRACLSGHPGRRQHRGRSAQTRIAALRMRLGLLPGRGGRTVLQTRLALHLFHLGRAASGRDQPGMLPRRSCGCGAVGDDAGVAAGSRSRTRSGPGAHPRGGGALGGADSRVRHHAAGARPRPRYRDVLSGGRRRAARLGHQRRNTARLRNAHERPGTTRSISPR